MSIITAVKNFEWRMAWEATKKFIFTIGCIAFVAWFTNLTSFWWMAFSAVWLGMIWYVFFLLERAWQKQRGSRRIVKRLAANRTPCPEPEGPKTRRRFLYFNPDTGDEVFKTEVLS